MLGTVTWHKRECRGLGGELLTAMWAWGITSHVGHVKKCISGESDIHFNVCSKRAWHAFPGGQYIAHTTWQESTVELVANAHLGILLCDVKNNCITFTEKATATLIADAHDHSDCDAHNGSCKKACQQQLLTPARAQLF